MATWKDEQWRVGGREGVRDAGGKDGRRKNCVDGGWTGGVTEGVGLGMG